MLEIDDVVFALGIVLLAYAAYLLYRRWKEMSKTATEEEKLWVREGIFFVISTFIVIIFSFHFLFMERLSNAMKSGISGFAALRIILPLVYVFDFLPGAVLGEFTYSRIKRRSFRPKNIFIFAIMFATWLLIAMVLLTAFDLLLPEVSFLTQFPLIALSLSLPTLVLAATSKIKKIRAYVKKAFD